MRNPRFDALDRIAQRKINNQADKPPVKVSEVFGQNTFSTERMKDYLTKAQHKELTKTIEGGIAIDAQTSEAIATAMKNWAMSHGATHFTHWFQPLNGSTAEKHDTFFTLSDGEAIERFNGSTLIRQEPDASSFPNGGIRQTFEARGYTAWDPTSPAFLMETGSGRTLCIPTIFVAYTGETLDYKAPLLRSIQVLDKAATAVCELFERNVKKVTATLGCEQEFFLIDRALYQLRPDLIHSGRTVFGRTPSKGQQLDDHYFGTIPTRVQLYLHDMEQEAWKLGIPITTRHNEVAPAQFEVAPMFEEANVAVDHNQLLMDVMRKVAERHDFMVLFHEKPFADLNGSGKHNNWALSTDTGKNLLAPTTKAKDNLQFLTFFVNTIAAVHKHAALMRASIASAGNDYRLGANEAPPAIISVFIGQQMKAILDELADNGNVQLDKGDNLYMKLGISKIPPILLDNTDRNRTSPFAFTGNKFEFRAVGSSANTSLPLTVLNVIMTDQLIEFKDKVNAEINGGKKREVAIVNVLREYIIASKDVIFEGNGYSEDWEKEAAKRKLPNIKTTPEALKAFISEQTISLFEKHNVLTANELHARYEILQEIYVMRLQIESRLIGDIGINRIIPASIRYQNQLMTNIRGLRELGLTEDADEILITLKKITKYTTQLKQNIYKMIDARKEINNCDDITECAHGYATKVKESYFDTIRQAADKLELLLADDEWPLVKYQELLFMR